MKKKRLSKTQKRETIGQTVYDNLHKQPDVTDPRDIVKQKKEDYYNDLVSVVTNGIKEIVGRVFFIEVVWIREKALQNYVEHPRYIARSSCPTPTWGQHAWQYDTLTQKLDLLWAIPFKDKAEWLKENQKTLTPGEKIQLDEVMRLDNGFYEQLARRMNNEPEEGDNRILINNEVEA